MFHDSNVDSKAHEKPAIMVDISRQNKTKQKPQSRFNPAADCISHRQGKHYAIF
jgi:hypothetical protein